MTKIDKNKTYTTRDGRAVRIYATNGRSTDPIHGAVKDDDGWNIYDWKNNGRYRIHLESLSDLIEALKPNGIPVDLPDPPEVEGYTWEARGWGFDSKRERINSSYWNSQPGDRQWKGSGCLFEATGRSNIFCVEYIPTPAIEMTLAEVCEALGKTIKIIK